MTNSNAVEALRRLQTERDQQQRLVAEGGGYDAHTNVQRLNQSIDLLVSALIHQPTEKNPATSGTTDTQ